MTDDLRDRIASVQAQHHHWDYAGSLTCACGETFGLGVEAGWQAAVAGWAVHVADAVIRELDLGIPCATTGCRMRQIARRHADASSGLERPTDD